MPLPNGIDEPDDGKPATAAQMRTVINELRTLRGELVTFSRTHPDRSITWGVVKGLFVYQFIAAACVALLFLISTLICGGAMNQVLKNLGAPTSSGGSTSRSDR